LEAKKLTESCYLISDSYGNKLGLGMIRTGGVLFTYDLEFYENIESIANKFNENLMYTEVHSNESSEKYIEDYPIKHDVFVDSQMETVLEFETYTYKIREESNVKFCAGWWVIHTDAVNRAALSPKLTTLTEQCHGPFKSRFDCQAEVTRLNKIKKETMDAILSID
jgi:hypothetical protein